VLRLMLNLRLPKPGMSDMVGQKKKCSKLVVDR
jgi:hypothetical protein